MELNLALADPVSTELTVRSIQIVQVTGLQDAQEIGLFFPRSITRIN